MFLQIFASGLLFASQAQGALPSYVEREEVRMYIEQLSSEHDLDREALVAILRNVKRQDAVLAAIQKPAESKPWHLYDEIFLTQARIEQGTDFWHAHQSILNKAQSIYTVPAEIIVAIIGVETFYGKYMGHHPVLDTLVTLAFDYPRAARFFRHELTEFFLLCMRSSISCTSPRGSYAGAMGYGQFIPSSYRAYAIDFDGNGEILLWGDFFADAIGSVANYLSHHAWQAGGEYFNPVAWENKMPKNISEHFINAQLKPWLKPADLEASGVNITTWKISEIPFSLWGFEQSEEKQEVLAAYWNSYVISRYNHSRKYVRVVVDLAATIRAQVFTDREN